MVAGPASHDQADKGSRRVSRASSVGWNGMTLTRVNSEKQRVIKRVTVRASGAEPRSTLNHNQIGTTGWQQRASVEQRSQRGPKAGIASARGSADPRPVA